MDNNSEENIPTHAIYTDGSKTKDCVGAAFVHFNSRTKTFIHKEGFNLASFCSITQAELFAIFKALCYLNQNKNLTSKTIAICSDSRAALMSISNYNSSDALVQQIITKLDNTNNNVLFFWIPAHTGITGNEEADHLAKEAGKKSTNPDYDIIPMVSRKRLIWNTLVQTWQRLWDEGETGRLTYGFFPKILDRLGNRHFSINFLTSQLFTGHGNFLQYLCRFKHSETQYCSCDNTSTQDSLHLIFDCRHYNRQREKLMQTVLLEGANWPCRHNILVNNETIYKELINFVNSTGALDPR
ncbi:uncharacterized protein LOC111639790 [Centruroides sculpturatus]|uniref:uncharacterized protein LOC111639790 n=1 Tax=Centruroides sculpturatus TaxID=218467 RepID=UPI000C6D3B9E|nr:uncharacterized protein LOC111639790 [Centruroides sculpturatus]